MKNIPFCVILFLTGFTPLANSNQKSEKEKASSSKKNQIKEYLWKGGSNKKPIEILFTCKTTGPLKVILTDPEQTGNKPGETALIRMRTGNVPPSGNGYVEFIHTGQFLKKGETTSISLSTVPRFIRELEVLQTQTIKNKEVSIKEYMEKITYCEQLPKIKRYRCHISSSRYQVAEPNILLWTTSERWEKARSYSIFNPHEIGNLTKLSCYSH